MSVSSHRERRPEQRKRILSLMEKEAARCNISEDIFWARLDTLFQLTPGGRNRNERLEMLCNAFPNWLKNISFQVQDLDEYDSLMMPGIYLESPKNPNLVLLQIGSLGAKVLWADLRYAHANKEQMYRLCLEKLQTIPAYTSLKDRNRKQLKADLRLMIGHYTDESGLCREIVRNFFKIHSDDYMNLMDALSTKLPDENMTQQADTLALPELQSEVSAPVEHQQEPLPPAENEPAVADSSVSITETIPISQADPEWLSQLGSSDAYRALRSQLDRIEASVAKLHHNADEFDDDASGLCRFVEKTASFVYSRPLSKLYQLYANMPEQISAKELEVILRSFFYVLRTLEIEPIDDKRFEEEFPEEYREEMARRGKTPVRYAMCGWSYRDGMLIAPQYEEDKRNAHE